MTVKWLKKFDRYCLHIPVNTVIVLLRSMSPDRVKKEKAMDDLQYLHYQTQLEEQQREEFLTDVPVLPEVWTQPENRNQTSMGETK